MDGLRMTLPAELASVAVARRLVSEQFADVDDPTLGDVELIVSELVTNAIRHGRPEIELRLRRDQFAIDVAVLDHGPDVPNSTPANASATSGRGLSIIDTLSQSWGCQALHNETGKVVWASITHTSRIAP